MKKKEVATMEICKCTSKMTSKIRRVDTQVNVDTRQQIMNAFTDTAA